MSKNKKLLYTVAAVLAFAAILMILVFISSVFDKQFDIRTRFFLAYGIGFVIFTLFIVAVAVVCETIEDEKIKKNIVRGSMILSFAVYLILFLGMLFLAKAISNRESFVFVYHKRWLSEALPDMVPFKNTVLNIQSAVNGPKRPIVVLFELFGNMFAFVPLAFFLPAFFKSLRSFDSFLPMIVFITVATEMFQGMFGLGSCKIDDFIFGAGFACITFYILRRPPIVKAMIEKYIYF